MVFKIKLLTIECSSKAARLIESGLKEYFPNYDSKYNPDLLNPYEYYKGENNVFLIGMMEDTLVATGGLICENPHTARIIRMSVKKEYRRKGFASKILEALEEKASTFGYWEIVLETTNTWHEAISFYKRNNYETISIDRNDIHFKKSIQIRSS